MTTEPAAIAPLLFTVLTPCYNSAGFIQRVYDSLCAQTLRSFEWVVIDDASTDDTLARLRAYQAQADFPVRIIEHSENRMVLAGFNAGIAAARGEFIILAGHDDAFVPEALARLYEAWLSIPPAERAGVSGVSCLCCDQHGQLIGSPYAQSPWLTDMFTVFFRHHHLGEKWGMARRDILQDPRFRFRDDIDRYVPEQHVWLSIALHYRALFINDALRVYFINQTSHESLSSMHKIRYVKGQRFAAMLCLNDFFWRVWPDKRTVLVTLLMYVRLSIHARMGFWPTVRDVRPVFQRVLVALAYPAGRLIAWNDRRKGRI